MRIAVVHNVNHGIEPADAEFDDRTLIEAIVDALLLRHTVLPIEAHRDILAWLGELAQFRPDFIFNIAEGYPSAAREAFYPALFEQLQIPYSGSDATTHIITHNKALTSKMLREVSVDVPWSVAVSTPLELNHVRDRILYPAFVKPNGEGSSIGIDDGSIVRNYAELSARVEYVWSQLNNIALIEEYIPRKHEVCVTYIEGLGQEIFGPTVYDYQGSEVLGFKMKNRSHGESMLRRPDGTDLAWQEQTRKSMKRAVTALGVRGYARADFRISPNGRPYLVDMNTQVQIAPSRNEVSATMLESGHITRSDFLFPLFHLGYTFDEVMLHIAEYAASHSVRLPSMAGIRDAGFAKEGSG